MPLHCRGRQCTRGYISNRMLFVVMCIGEMAASDANSGVLSYFLELTGCPAATAQHLLEVYFYISFNSQHAIRHQIGILAQPWNYTLKLREVVPHQRPRKTLP